MVYPDDDVARRVAMRSHRERRSVLAKHDQRAGRIEADAGDGVAVDACRGDGRADAGADGVPDVVARLLDDRARLAVECDVAAGASQQRAAFVEDTGARCPFRHPPR